ncbi:MAG: threonine synthase [Deltaproteobacteria bacterium]|nr:threonine synthase [Deltaproteobacteria bacterium]
MEYISTRGSAPAIPSQKAILKGIAEDNGLYVPSILPHLGIDPFAGIEKDSYAARALRILQPFLPDYSPTDLGSACEKAYAGNFDYPQTAPVRFLDDGTAVLELWHGPTQAFKDMALQIMPLLLSIALRGEKDRYDLVILVATSGDTGKAALEGFADVPGVRIFVFYPHEGVSRIQRLQMVTQRGKNVGVCAVRGNFDDAQNGVKQIFGDSIINNRLESAGFRLSSANSINWGRLAPQVVYYFTGYEQMVRKGKIRRGQRIPVCVPTGNFGNILAAYYASRCGLPVSRLICASNRNKVLTDFINTGTYDRRREFFKTESPSMDILISSNLERLLFELGGRNPVRVSEWMGKLKQEGRYSIPGDVLKRLQSLFYGGFTDQQETLEAIRLPFEKHEYLMDPHTAVGYWVLQKYRKETGDETPALLASTASPFKFNRAVLEALGRNPGERDEFALLKELGGLSGVAVPAKLAELKDLPELHPDVCAQAEMAQALYRFLGMMAP